MTSIIIAALFAGCVVSTGFGVLRMSRIARGATAFGLSPAVGLAVLIVGTIWISYIGLPPVVGTALLLGGSSLGAVMAIRERGGIRESLAAGGEPRWTILLVVLSLVVPAIVLGAAFNSVVVPLSTDDGAHHVEIINQLRQGGQWAGWYPRGFHSIAAAFLQLTPSVDSALGAQGIGVGLALLAPVSVFGLGVAVIRRASAAAAAAVVIGLTAHYPYQIQFWDGWPLAVGIVLAVALWTIGIEYLEHPSSVWAVLGALLAAGTLLTHGTELFTAAIGLVFVLIAGWRRVHWGLLSRHLAVAIGIAVALLVPYVAELLPWYLSGGAQSAGEATLALASTTTSASGHVNAMLTLLPDVVGGIFVDAPVRVCLVLVGTLSVFHARTGRLLAALGLTFLGIAAAFKADDIPLIGRIFALTFPWSLDYRLLMVTAICASLLAGVGLVRLTETALHLRRLRLARTARLVLTAALFGTMALLEQRLATEAPYYLTYTPDDAAALHWLGQHVSAGELVINDGSADAGIWAPYKGGASILLPRVLPVPDRGERELVIGHVGEFQDSPQTVEMACGLGARYVYAGESGTAWEQRQFPARAALQQSLALDEVFSQGDAAVFRIRCDVAD